MSESSTMSARLIGEIFVERGLIAREQLEEALVLQERTGERLGEILVGSFGVSRLELASVLAEQWAAVERAPDPVPAPPGGQEQAASPPDPDGNGEGAEIRRPIGEIFLERGFATEAELEAALELQRESGDRLGEVLVAQGVMSRLDLASALAEQWSSLQKLRPPAPKAAEPWQEAAVRAATEAAPAPTPESAPAAEAGVVEVGSVVQVGVEAERLGERLVVVEGRLGELVDRAALGEVREALEALGSRGVVDARVEGLVAEVEGVGAAVEGLRGELEAVRGAGVDEAVVRGLEASVVALGERLERLVGREELEGLRAEVASAASGLPGVQAGLAELEGRLAELRGVVDGVGAAAPQAVEGLELRVAEGLAGVEAARLELGARVEGLSGRVEELAARLEARQPEAVAALEQVRATVAALAARLETETTVDPERITELEQVLGVLAQSLEERLEAVESIFARLGDRAELDALAQRLEEVRQELAATPARPDLERVQTGLDGRVRTIEELLDGFAARFDVARSEADIAFERLRTELVGHAQLDGLAGELHGSLGEVDRRIAETEGALGHLTARVGATEAAPAALHEELMARIAEVGQGLEGLGARLGAVESRPTLPPDELEHRLAEVHATLEAGRDALDDHLRSLVGHDRLAAVEHALTARIDGTDVRFTDHAHLLEALHSRLGAVEAAPGHLREELDTRIGGVGQGLEQLAARLGAVEVRPVVLHEELDTRLEVLGRGLEEIGARLGAVETAPDALREELGARLGAVSDACAEVDRRVGAMESARAVSPEELEARVGAATHELSEWLTVQLAELGGSLATLHGRFAELAASRGDADERLASLERLSIGSAGRLDVVETASREEHATLRTELAGLAARLDAELAREDARAEATERALRKGLAGLGERLVAGQQEYLETGNALRRSIERLGAAVIEADVRADHPLDPPASGHVAFVPTVEGYRLVPFDGPAPAVGAQIELPELGTLVVTRIARSPLPLDGRACAYLERTRPLE